jgi:hypothetical protein
MKTKTFLAFIVICSLFISGAIFSSNAQSRPLNQRPKTRQRISPIDTVERSIILTSYPTNFVAATIKVGYEFKVSHNKGLKFIGSFGSSNENSDWYGLNEFKEFGLEAQLRFYVQKDHPALNGFYLAPYASYKSMSYTTNNTFYNLSTGQAYSQTGNVSNFMLGYVIGYQWIFNSSFVIDAFIGGGNNFISGDNTQGNLSNTIYAYRNGIDLHTGIGLGVAF